MNKVLLFGFFMLTGFWLAGQTDGEARNGEVSYVSSKNVYVKFESTQGIEVGDTLYFSQNNQLLPGLRIINKSSISCVCEPLGTSAFLKGDKVVYPSKKPAILVKPEEVVKVEEEETRVVPKVLQEPEKPQKEVSQSQTVGSGKSGRHQKSIRGRLSIAAYNNFSTFKNNSNRMLYRFSLNGNRIGQTRFSTETYVTYRHNQDAITDKTVDFDGIFRVYNLAVKYDFSESSHLWAGRKINPRVASLGAMDGLQYEQHFGSFLFGALGGFRPDFQDFGFNPKLLEYGALVGHASREGKPFTQTSLAMMVQQNGANTDRRFVYFQHTNSFLNNLHVYTSVEMDLYKLENNQPKNTISLTNWFINARYRVNKNLSFSASFDTRKNIIYYETFRSYLDQLLDDEARQGLRFQVNYRLFKFVSMGASSSRRFQNNSANFSSNLNGYLTFSRIPGLKASATLSANILETNYLKGQIYSFRISRDFWKGKVNGDVYFRMVRYDYPAYESSLVQEIGGLSASYRFTKTISLFLFGEGTFQKDRTYYRLNTKLIKRF